MVVTLLLNVSVFASFFLFFFLFLKLIIKEKRAICFHRGSLASEFVDEVIVRLYIVILGLGPTIDFLLFFIIELYI